jgi:hypothetical protein
MKPPNHEVPPHPFLQDIFYGFPFSASNPSFKIEFNSFGLLNINTSLSSSMFRSNPVTLPAASCIK